jgi:glycosyltransferase involved in cell wall biosynthesis
VTLQGEAPFLDALPHQHAAQAWHELAAQAQHVDAFVPVSQWYADLMTERLGLARDRVQVIHNGVDLAGFDAEPLLLVERRPSTIGYLARMCRDKGLHTLVEAFIDLAGRADSPSDLRLRVVGARLTEDASFVDEQQRRLRAAGLGDRVDFHANVQRSEKLEHLRRFSVLSVPATYGESFGLYLLEALAAGVPVVQPRHAAFPELIAATGGGLLCTPDDAGALADGLAELLHDPARAQALADRGRRAVLDRFVADRMAAEFIALCRILCPRGA